jgi:kynurenine formamidase
MLVDLTLSLPENSPVFRKVRPDWAMPSVAGHIGTHLDTLLHRPIPIEWMEREGVLIDARGFGDDIDEEAIAGLEIRPGDFVIFRTGQTERFDYGTDEYFRHYPQLDWSLVQRLIGCKVSFVGTDAAGLRRGKADHEKVDLFCETNGAWVIENLANLGDPRLHGHSRFPVRLAWFTHGGMTGIPVKVVASVA